MDLNNAILLIITTTILSLFCGECDLTSYLFTPHDDKSYFGNVYRIRQEDVDVSASGWFLQGNQQPNKTSMALGAELYGGTECSIEHFSIYYNATHNTTEGDAGLILTAGNEYISLLFDYDGRIQIGGQDAVEKTGDSGYNPELGGIAVYPNCGSNTLPKIPNDSTDTSVLFLAENDLNDYNGSFGGPGTAVGLKSEWEAFWNWRDGMAGGDRRNWNELRSVDNPVGNHNGGFELEFDINNNTGTTDIKFIVYDIVNGNQKQIALEQECTINSIFSYDKGNNITVEFSPDYDNQEQWFVYGINITTDCSIESEPPTPQPTGPTPQPTPPTPQPTGPTLQPTPPTPQPTPPTPQPTGPTLQPTPPTPQPTGPTPQPTPPTLQPTGPTPEPTGPTPEPTGPTPEPTGPTPEPTGPTPQPTGPTLAPTGPTQAPTGPTQSPTAPTQAPTGPTQAPTGPTKAPTGPTQAPTGPTLAPTGPTMSPTGPTLSPSGPTMNPTVFPTESSCAGCRVGSGPQGSCYNLDCVEGNDNIWACHGIFGPGFDRNESDAELICADGYHVCTSESETEALGLTYECCISVVGPNEVYLTRESATRNGLCMSQYGGRGNNNVFGCGNVDATDSSNGATCWKENNCGVLGVICGDNDTPGFITFNGNHNDEYNNVQVEDSTHGGVICCKNNPTPYPTPQPPVAREPRPCINNPCSCDELDSCMICHSNGCDQCNNGYFKKDYNYQCESCLEIFGTNCMHCTDFTGCQQCYDGHRTYNEDTGLFYCPTPSPVPIPAPIPTVPSDPTVPPTDRPSSDVDTPYPGGYPDSCTSSPCSCDEVLNCQVCNSGSGCSQCLSGYFSPNNNVQCSHCQDTFGDNCMHCASQGCQQCSSGTLMTDATTGLRYCA